MAQDEASLQRWLAQEEGDRDAAKFALHRLQSTAEFYRQRLLGLLVRGKGGEGAVSRARELLRDLEAEVTASDSNSGGMQSRTSNYEVLSSSLKETQRSCDSLNREMVQQASSNEKLVESMGTVKAANKRLLEQIRTQQAEIGQLTQQCVNTEERTEQLRRRQELDREAARQEALHQAAILRENGAERRSEVQQQLTGQLRKLQLGAVGALTGAQQLSQELQVRRQESVAFLEEVFSWLHIWKQEVPKQLLEPFQRQKKHAAELEKSIGELRARLATEREQGQQEKLELGRKHGEMQTDKEDLQARIVRECSQLESRLQALEKRQLEERQSWIEERTRLEQLCGEHQQHLDSCQAQRERLQRDQVVAESALSGKVSETQSLEKVAAELQRQSREAEDALQAAVSSNEHLREQLQEQQGRFQEKNSREAAECQQPLAERLQDHGKVVEAELALGLSQLEAMEDDIQGSDQELVRLLNDQEATLEGLMRMEKEAQTWRGQWDEENAHREVLENELNAAKHHFNGEQVALQATCEKLSTHIEDLEQEIRSASDELVQKRRHFVSREAESSTRQAAAEAHLKESQELLASCRDRLREAADQRARSKSEAENQRAKCVEVIGVLERDLENQVQVLLTVRERYEAMLQNEQKVHTQAKQECDRETELASSVTRQARSESRHRLEGMERERSRIEETRRTELAQGQEYVAHLQLLADDLEKHLDQVRTRLSETETSLSVVRQECFQEECEGIRLQRELEEEVHHLSSHLDRSRRDDSSLTKRAEAHRFRSDQERRDLLQSLTEARRSARQPSEPVTAQ